jgi:curved DNA-binding protein CbpA
MRGAVKATASNCPYSTLGVPPSADDTEIKQAYRKLVLQYHPDVCQTSGAERKFMTIQQAYELLTGKGRGGADGRGGQQRGDWAFHDWYWSFMQKRRWGSYKKGSAAAASQAEHAASADPTGTPFHQQPEHKSTLRSQLAGLRHRAAIRGNKKGPRYAGAAAGDGQAHVSQDDAEVQEQAEAMASLEYDSTEMSDGCNMASGISDWEAAAAEHAAQAAKRRFSATGRHKDQVMSQVAGLHRMAATAQDAGGMS